MSDTITPQAPASPSSDHAAAERLKQSGRAVRDDVRELGSAAADMASETLEAAGDRANAFVDEQKQRLGQFEEATVDYVREKPIKSVLLAAGVGTLLGLLLSRR